MAIHVLPPVPEEPTDTGPDLVPAPDLSPALGPFWAAVRRRRPDLPLVLLGAALVPDLGPEPGPAPGPAGGGDR